MFWDLYVAVIYGILYLSFVAYPIVFSGIRGWSNGKSGLAFIGMGVGTFIVIGIEPLIRRVINSHRKDAETGKPHPEAQVSVVCIAAVMAPIGQFWFAWTCVPVSIHWIWSILAGVPLGLSNTTIFIYASNYLAGSYGIYAASALAGNSVVRSILGSTLPLAAPTMYKTLNPNWAGTLLGGLEVILIPIPFVFYKWGGQIREKSAIITLMRNDQMRNQRKAETRVQASEEIVIEEGEKQ
jgi:hypothetical protein